MKAPVKWSDECQSHPEYGEHHECAAAERICVYCGVAIEAYPCHGCGEFLTAAAMHEGSPRCEECI